ncbi:MAG: hypothetical protein IKH86_08040 [Prevotella sp.]|nr:hypothetical protein [Prevotella sp.]
MKKNLSLCLFVLLALGLLPSAGRAQARHHCVVIDSETYLPVSHASIYTKTNGKFNSAITDARGRATVMFSFKTLTVSHLNYERRQLRSLPDTILLTPKYHLAAELVVSSEPAWIRPMLRRFVKQKKQFYGSKPLTLAYHYNTRNIEGQRYYHYQSDGLLKMAWNNAPDYEVCQQSGIITSADSTRLTDMTNLRRMLYEDFVSEFDNGFIRSHRFSVSERDSDLTDDEVELIFRAKHNKDDHGRFVIDTTRLIIREAVRTMGVKANKQARVSATMLALSRMMSGYNITAWDVDYGVTYTPTDSCWHPKDIRYKFFFRATENIHEKEEASFDSLTGGGFSNMESTLTLKESTFKNEQPAPLFKPLPRTWYIKINTDAERAYEIELANMPAQFVLFKEEE